MQERIDDSLQFNVPFVWLIDPRLKRAYVYTTGRMTEARTNIATAEPEIAAPLDEIF
jgi:hypothetical protein